MDNIWLMLLLQVILIALNAVFACAEIAVISANETTLENLAEQGDKRAKKLRRLTAQPARFLATIQVAITLAGFLGSALAADNFAEPLTAWIVDDLGFTLLSRSTVNTISVIIITLILSYFTLIFGELVPKRLAQRKAEAISLRIAPLVSAISVIFGPIVWLLTVSTNGILRLMRIDPNAENESVSEEDIRMMADAGSKKGVIEEEENELIQNVFEFNDLTAGEIATHRTDMTVLWLEDSDEEWENTILESKYTRYPVCNETVDNVVGVLNSKFYFRLQDHDRETVMREAVRPAYLVPESVKADVLFRNMKANHTSFAVVLDEYGGTEGIITRNDLIERLVGDFEEETDLIAETDAPSIERLEDGVWKVRGDATIDDLQKELGMELPEGDYDTFNGLVFSRLDAIPADGSTFDTEIDNLCIRVTEILNHQVESAIVYLKKPEAPAAEELPSGKTLERPAS